MSFTDPDLYDDVHSTGIATKGSAEPGSEDVFLSAGEVRRYDFKATNIKRTKATPTPENRNAQSYEVYISFLSKEPFSSDPEPSVILYRKDCLSPDVEGAVVGVGMVDILTAEDFAMVKLGPRSPLSTTPEPAQPWMKLPVFNIDFNPITPAESYEWKCTRSGDAKKVDWLNLKFEKKPTGEIVARFLYKFWMGSKRGHFEIVGDEGVGDGWFEVVLLSDLTFLEDQEEVFWYDLVMVWKIRGRLKTKI